MDKENQGAREFIRTIHSKNPLEGILSASHRQFNRNVSEDRIIVEKFFERLTSLWALVYSTWKWADKNYDPVMNLCVSLPKYHIQIKLLRGNDLEFYEKSKTRFHEIGVRNAEKLRRTQEIYQYRSIRRMYVQCRNPSLFV